MSDNWQLKAIISANADGMIKTLKGVADASKSTRKYVADLGSSASNLSQKVGVPFALLSGVLGGFSMAAVGHAVVGFTELAESIKKGSLRAGVSVEEYQRLKYVAEQSGVQIELLEGSLGKLNKQLGEAASGKNADLAVLMGRLGIKMRDVNGQVRSGADLLPELADAFTRNENASVRARMGMALFGKSWQEVIPMLTDGSEDIKNNLARFERLKSVIDPKDIDAAKALGDKFSDLSFVVKGFQNTIANQLVPVLLPVIEDLIQWAAENRKLIATNVSAFVKDLVAWIKQVDWSGVIASTKGFIDSVGSLIDKVGGAKNALIGLALVLNLQTITSLFGLGAALLKAGWAFGAMAVAAWPITAVVAAVAASAFLVWNSWDSIGPKLVAIWNVIKTSASVAWNLLKFLFSWSPLGMIVNNWGALTGWMGLLWDGVSSVVSAKWQLIKGVVAAGLDFITSALMNWGPIRWIVSALEPIVEYFKKTFKIISDIIQPVVESIKSVSSHVVGAFGAQFGADSNHTYGPRLNAPLVDGGGAIPSLIGSQPKGRVDGQVTVRFDGAPQGTRFEQSGTGSMPINLDVGYRSLGNGVPG